MVSDDFRGALFILAGMLIFSVQDVLIRQLSDGGSLLQVLTIRGVLGALVISIFVRLTGRQLTISSSYPFLAASRVVLFFVGFLCFYFALSHMRLAEATALFFASPLFYYCHFKNCFERDSRHISGCCDDNWVYRGNPYCPTVAR